MMRTYCEWKILEKGDKLGFTFNFILNQLNCLSIIPVKIHTNQNPPKNNFHIAHQPPPKNFPPKKHIKIEQRYSYIYIYYVFLIFQT